MFTCTLQAVDVPLNSCLNFRNTEYEPKNTCFLTNASVPTLEGEPIMPCSRCRIHNSNIIIKPNCSKDFECLYLYFCNNSVFESFFIKHRHIIKDLFPTNMSRFRTTITITIDTYNIGEITNEYVNSTFNMDFPGLIMTIYLLYRRPYSNLFTVDVHNISIGFRSLTILTISHLDGVTGNYTIIGHEMNVEHNVAVPCQNIESDIHVSNIYIRIHSITTFIYQ